jgi:hypothetical protein
MLAQCACGRVKFEASGAPIASVVCYCDDCQEGSRRVEALPGAIPIRDSDGGTPYAAYRKDRVRFMAGSEHLVDQKLTPKSATSRVIANCCNAAIMLRFDDARHWVSIYRARIRGDLPPIEMRVCTKFASGRDNLPRDVPNYAGFAPRFLVRLLVARMAMLVGR